MRKTAREAHSLAGTRRRRRRLRAVADALVYALLRVVWAAARLVPLRLLRPVLEATASLVARVDRRHRRVVRENLNRAFPDWPAEKISELEVAAFRNWGRLAAEAVHCERLLAAPPSEGLREALRRASDLLAAGGGLLVLTAHTGNFELLARRCAASLGRPVWIFHRTMRNRMVDAFLRAERERWGVLALGRGAGVRQALRALARGQVVAVPLDQNQLPGHGEFVDFFGCPACTSTLLARLSLATGRPVLPVFAVWSGEICDVVVGDPIFPPPQVGRHERRAVVRELTARYTREVEGVIRRWPSQWNWAHRRWKTRPPGEAAGAAGLKDKKMSPYEEKRI